MLSVLSKLFNSNEKEIARLKPIITEINGFAEQMKQLKDTDFVKKTQDFKKRLADGEGWEFLLPEAFALVREAAHRSIGLRHYDVQMMAATTLAQGKIAEQKTGEGKTLSATPALYLHSLSGKGVHLVTVNDYLARRDAGWMGPLFHLLGVSVSALISEQSFIYDPAYIHKEAQDFRLLHLRPISRQEAYKADIVYGINSEFGFDYLRDNMAQSIQNVVQRGHHFAIVDEVDSVLIDEARTPHIISAPDEVPTNKYYEYAKVVDKLSSDTDYKIDEKLKTAHLTDHGIAKIEKMFGIADIYEKDFDTVYHLEAALKARTLFHREKDYIVKDSEVILVDEFTGRLMVGRRLSEGLHQAIEAKENVPIQRESKTLATVSLQNYFRMYDRLAGMTGTAATEAEEFHQIYKLDVVTIPTNNVVTRVDHQDLIYKTQRSKYSAIADEIEKIHKTGQPILIGTTSIDKNEIISQTLKRRGIKHEVLNAKNHEREAEIIAKAGEKAAVTVATNMAGRGVDIILGGESPNNEDGTSKVDSAEYIKWKKNHDEVLRLGGLCVIGTERHESRRIDNQLRGRSGRQGDPGSTRFFVALDDDIMRLFGGETISNLMTRFNMPEDVPLQHALVTRAIEQAQIKVEGYNFDIRKHLVEYDDVLNKQREIVYKRRRKSLEATHSDTYLKDEMIARLTASVHTIVSMKQTQAEVENISVDQAIAQEISTIIPFDEASQQQLFSQLEQLSTVEEKSSFLEGVVKDVYNKREEQVTPHVMREVERFSSLSVIDTMWTDHLDAIDSLRQGINLRGYGQRDPLVEYKNEAYRLFETLIAAIDDEIVHRIFKIQVEQQQMPTHQHVIENVPASEVSEAKIIKQKKKNPVNETNAPKNSTTPQSKKLGRNDPCWCGSGKKYKKCHFPQLPA
ncbi:MAG TPA: preprotein translocase subunit SecA [Candidatus Saccharimonadales bacterium]|nr:preprotein translocase subunit SecA [Candidatus Saccharimonadales bacterium]